MREKPLFEKIILIQGKSRTMGIKRGGDSCASLKRFEKFKELKVLKFQNPRREYCGFR